MKKKESNRRIVGRLGVERPGRWSALPPAETGKTSQARFVCEEDQALTFGSAVLERSLDIQAQIFRRRSVCEFGVQERGLS